MKGAANLPPTEDTMTIRPGLPCMLLSAPSRGRKACVQHPGIVTCGRWGDPTHLTGIQILIDAKTELCASMDAVVLFSLSALYAAAALFGPIKDQHPLEQAMSSLAAFILTCVTCSVPTTLTSMFLRNCSMGWYIRGPCTARPALFTRPKRVWPSRAFLTCTADQCWVYRL